MAQVVVADSGPLHSLVLIDCAKALQGVFDQVVVPTAVARELSHRNTPAKVKRWISQRRPWFHIRRVARSQPFAGLHPGETEALHLALEVKASAVLIDDMDARRTARRLGLTVVGTIGILELADEMALIHLPDAIEKLRQTNFFISPDFLDAVLDRHRKRTKGAE